MPQWFILFWTQVWGEVNQPRFSTDNLVAGLSQATLSRTSSKAGLGDDGDDEDFSCPFAVDDMDPEENIPRYTAEIANIETLTALS